MIHKWWSWQWSLYQEIVFHRRETSLAAIEFSGESRSVRSSQPTIRWVLYLDTYQRTVCAQSKLYLCTGVSKCTLHGVQISLKTTLAYVSHTGRHKGRKSAMVSGVVGWQCYQSHGLALDLSPGREENLVSNISLTFVLTKCLLIEVESPVGFSLVNWWAWEKLQYQEIDCKIIIHHGLLGRNFSTGSLQGASEGRTQEESSVEVWFLSLDYQVQVKPRRPLCQCGAELWQQTLETLGILITNASCIHHFLTWL